MAFERWYHAHSDHCWECPTVNTKSIQTSIHSVGASSILTLDNSSCSVVVFGNWTCCATIPISAAARIFIRMYTLESSRPPTCTIAKPGADPGNLLCASNTSAFNVARSSLSTKKRNKKIIEKQNCCFVRQVKGHSEFRYQFQLARHARASSIGYLVIGVFAGLQRKIHYFMP